MDSIDRKRWLDTLDRSAAEPDRFPPPAGDYWTPTGILRQSDRLLRSAHGRIEVIGQSYEGRPLWAMHFGRDEPGGIFLVSLLHACEFVGSLALLALAEKLVAARPGAPLTIVPIANPDGAERVRASAWNGSIRFSRGNARGIDLNRNFPGSHRAGGFWSRVPYYRSGASPASEPETAAIVRVARAAAPASAISFHNFGRWIFIPPAHRRSPLPQTAIQKRHIESIGGARSIGYRSGQLGRWAFWFRAFGTEIDFLSTELGAHAYLIEVSRGGIGRWGLRRLLVPFFAYNPPSPHIEVDAVANFCARLISGADSDGTAG